MSYYPPNAEGGAYGPPAGNANQNQGPPGYGAPAPQQGYTAYYPPASMGHPSGYPAQGNPGQQGGYPAPGGYYAPAGNHPASAYGAPSTFNPAAAAPGYQYPGASYGPVYGYPAPGGYHAPMMPGQQGGYPILGSYSAPAGNAHAYGAPSGSQLPDNRAPYGPSHAPSALQGMPGQQGGYPAYHAPPGHHPAPACGAPVPFYPTAAAPGSQVSDYRSAAPAPSMMPRPPNGSSASIGEMPPSLSDMSISAPAYGGGFASNEAGVPGAEPGTPVSGSSGVYGNQTPNNVQDTNLSVQRALPAGAAGPSGNGDADRPAAAAVTEPNRCSCAPVHPAATSEIPEEYEFISREGSLSLTQPPPSDSCGCHAADPHAAASIPEEYEVIPPTGSVSVTQPPRDCSCGCHPADPVATGSRSAVAVGAFDINKFPAATSLVMSKTINILVMFVSGTTTDNNYVFVNASQQTQVQSWWEYAKQFYKSRNPNLDINIKYQNLQINNSIKIPLVPTSLDEAEQNWRLPAVKQWLEARNLPVSNAPYAGLINVNTLVEYTRDNGPGGQPGNWAFVCFITNLPHFAGTPATPTQPAVLGQSPTYFGPNQRVVQYYEYNQWFNFGPVKDQLAYTHEMCHVFGGRDEYATSIPDPCKGTNNVPNNNAVLCNNISASLKTNCLMKETGNPDGDKMCYYTRGQIGWPVMQPVQRVGSIYGMRTFSSMSAVSYDNALWVFYAQTGSNYLGYYNTVGMTSWGSGHINDYKVTQTEKSTAAVAYNNLLYVFYIPKDHQQFNYIFYNKNTGIWSNTYKLETGMDKPLYASFLSAAVLGTSLYLFYEPALGQTSKDDPKKSVRALSIVPSGTSGQLTIYHDNLTMNYSFKPSDFGLAKNDICAAAVTVMRQTKKNASGVDVTTQNMVMAYTQYTLTAGAVKPVGVLSCSFADGVSTIVGATWKCNPYGPQLHRSDAGQSLGMLAICSSDNDFGTYYLAGVDNFSNTTGAVNTSSSTDLEYFSPVETNTNYGWGGVATTVFNNKLVTFSATPLSGNDKYMCQETGYGV